MYYGNICLANKTIDGLKLAQRHVAMDTVNVALFFLSGIVFIIVLIYLHALLARFRSGLGFSKVWIIMCLSIMTALLLHVLVHGPWDRGVMYTVRRFLSTAVFLGRSKLATLSFGQKSINVASGPTDKIKHSG